MRIELTALFRRVQTFILINEVAIVENCFSIKKNAIALRIPIMTSKADPMKDKVCDILWAIPSVLIAVGMYYVLCIWRPHFLQVLFEKAIIALSIAGITCYFIARRRGK